MELSPKLIIPQENKVSLSKRKTIQITPCILSDYNSLKLEPHNKNNSIKYAYGG
jgi:hypothetical protein